MRRASTTIPPHITRLITINPATGIGTLVGTMAPDIIMVGLAYDPFHQVMYGAGITYAGTPRNLYRIDTNTAIAIGYQRKLPAQGLQELHDAD